MSDLDLKAQTAHLERRIANLELICFGRAHRAPAPHQVLGLYVETTQILLGGDLPTEAVKGWCHAFLLLDEVALLELSRGCEDPMPWVPFLKLLAAFREAGLQEDVAAAEAHVRRLAKSLLKAQGLELVHPDDLLARPPHALSGLSRS